MATLIAENLKAAPLPKNTLVVAREDGRLYVVDFSERPQRSDSAEIDWDVSIAKIIVGKLQQSRTRLLTVEEVEFENVTHSGQSLPGASADLQLSLSGSLDGKNESFTVIPTTSIDDDGYVLAKCRVTAKNFSLQVVGSYIMNTVQVTVHQSGRR